jgi:LAO/AO transport system kinase
VLTCSALETGGIEEIWRTVLAHREVFLRSGELDEKRRQQAVAWMWSLVDEGLKGRFARHPGVRKHLPHVLREVEGGRLAPTAAAERLLFSLDNKL